MTLSIIVPVHNGALYLKQCLDSLLYQSVSIDEIIIVNDHSTDETYKICREYIKANKQVVYLESMKKGVSAARNYGIEHATGDIIGFCDADDIEIREMCKTVKNHFRNRPATQILITGYEKLFADVEKRNAKICRYRNSEFWSKNKALKHTIFDENILGSVCNKFFKSELIRNIKFDEKLLFCEDMDFALRAISRCKDKDIYVSSKITYQYVINKNSVTNNENALFEHSTEELWYNVAFFKMAERDYISPNIRKYLYYKVFVFSLNIISFYETGINREAILKKNIRKTLPSFIFLFWILPWENFKYFIKYIFRIRRMKPFSW